MLWLKGKAGRKEFVMKQKVNTAGSRFSVLRIISAVYFALLFYLTLFLGKRQEINNYREKVNLQLLDKTHGYYLLSNYGKFLFFVDVIGNIILFIPFATALYILFSVKNKMLLGFVILFTTIGIESLQFAFNLGVFDVDDIALNLTGGIAGIYLYNILRRKHTV